MNKKNNIIDNFVQHTPKDFVLLDTGVFLLLLQGLKIEEPYYSKYNQKSSGYLMDKNTIEKMNNNENGYSTKDFKLLSEIVDNYEKIMTTPHILTEISNLNKSKKRQKSLTTRNLLFNRLKALIASNLVYENFVNITDIIKDSKFNKFGVTDIGILNQSKNSNIGVITDDSKFSGYLNNNQIPCINFKELRNINQ